MRIIKRKLDSKETKDRIIQLFYIEHLSPTDISNKLNVKMPYITKIIQTDSRYTEEKEERKQKNKEKQKEQKRIYAQNKRQKDKKEKQEYLKLLVQIDNDNKLLSTKKIVSDLKYAKWNRSVYEYDKASSDLVLKDTINAGYNVAKRVRNIVNPNSIKSKKINV